MPIRINPNNPRQIQHFINGKWKHKQTCGSPAKAKAAFRLLKGLEKGTIKKEDVGKK